MLLFWGADSAHCVFDVSVNEKVYDIGFIFSDYMAEEAAKTERKYLEDLRRYICDNTQKNIVMLVGKKSIRYIKDSQVIRQCMYAQVVSGLSHSKEHILL